MNREDVLLLAMILFAFPYQANAEQAGTLRGIGFSDCRSILDWQSNSSEQIAIYSWIYGFWSAENRQRFQLGVPMKNIMHTSVSPSALSEQLRSFCNEHPSSTLTPAVDDIFARLPDFVEQE